MQVQASLELTDHKVIIGISLDTLNGESANPWVGLSRELFRLGITSLKVERLLAVESEDLGGRHDVAPVEDSQAGVLIGDLRRLLPGELNGVVHNVVHGEVTNTEDRGEDGAGESTATSNGLILVQGEGKVLAKELGNGFLDGGHTSSATNHFDKVDVFGLELSLSQGLLQRSGDALKVRLDHHLQLLTLDDSADIRILHKGLDVHGGGRVGRQNLLHLLCSGDGTRPGFRVCADINLEVLLELIGEVFRQSTVKVPTTEVTVVGSGLDIELTLAEFNNGSSVVGVSDVNEHDAARLLIVVRQVELGDTVSKSGGGVVVDESEHLEAGNLTGIEHGPTLDIGEPGGDTNSDI